MNWRTIESAPRDGSQVLLLAEGFAIQGAWIRRVNIYDRDISGWEPIELDWHGCGCCQGGTIAPTHWMPLPELPAP